MIVRVAMVERTRWVPHKKQDMVVELKLVTDTKGEPPTLDWYRRPSSRILVLFDDLDMVGFYRRRYSWANWRYLRIRTNSLQIATSGCTSHLQCVATWLHIGMCTA